MNATIARLRPLVSPVAWGAGTLVSCAVVHAFTGPGLMPAARGVAAVFAVLMMLSLVIPGISLARASGPEAAWREGALRWGSTVGGALGGSLVGVTVYAAFFAARAVPAVLASVLVIASCALSFAALARAMARLLARFPGGHLAGAGAAGAALLALAAVPFWTSGLVRTGAGFAWSGLVVGASPFLAAAMPWTGAAGPWSFDPRTSPVLYGTWVGTDVPLVLPSWGACLVGHALFAAAAIGFAEVLPSLVTSSSRRRQSGHGAQATGQ